MTDEIARLATRLDYMHELELEGFNYPVPPYGGLAFRSFSPAVSGPQFEAFAERVCQCLGQTYLPIYRMADGEFAFLVGWRAPARQSDAGVSLHALRWMVAELSQKAGRRVPSTIWGEAYRRSEVALALQRLEQSLRCIAQRGILAMYIMQRADHWGEQYLKPVSEWFSKHSILITSTNYVPFYFVYALLNGPARKRLYVGRHVLVVTHLTAARVEAIETGLKNEGVASVQFLSISSNRAMLDQLDLAAVQQPVDLALVAAGIGSVNILMQLEPLGIPCIDVGISLECLVNFERRFDRPFLLDDERIREYDPMYERLRFLVPRQ